MEFDYQIIETSEEGGASEGLCPPDKMKVFTENKESWGISACNRFLY